MAQEILFNNNAVSTLLAGITNAAISLSVQAGKGALFASPGANQIQKITLFKTDLSAVEVVHLTARSVDTFTVARGQEGTAAVAWNSGDGVMAAATAAVFTGASHLDRTETHTAKKTFSAGIAVAAGAAITGITEFGNGIGPGYLNNVGFTSSVAANALTNALKGQDGVDPSATNPVEVSFRSTTLATALPVVRKLTAAMSVVAPQGATLGFVINTVGTFTVTIASPAVVTLTNHGLVEGQMVRLATTGALPTGLAAATDYFVKAINSSTFNLAATLGGANINTSGSQSGVHTLTSGEVGYVYKYLVDDGTTRALAVSKKAIFDESLLHTTTAIGTGSDSDNVLYSTSALSNCAVRLIGRELIQTGMAAVGDWPNAPTRREVWAPEMNKTAGVLASASGSHATLAWSSSATFASPVNVEVGDLVFCTYTVEAVRNGADFAYQIRIGIDSGTAVMENTNIVNDSNRRTMEFHGPAIFGAGYIYKSQGHVARVVTAGTIVRYGASAASLYGTTPINQRSHCSVQVIRPNP